MVMITYLYTAMVMITYLYTGMVKISHLYTAMVKISDLYTALVMEMESKVLRILLALNNNLGELSNTYTASFPQAGSASKPCCR